MGEVGTGQAICPGACYAVAGGASGAEEKTLATGSPGRLRRGRGALPRLHQRGEIPWPMRDDDKSHQCMGAAAIFGALRSEEHTSELQSLMRISYAVFCLKKKKTNK